jgi:hypothetical protein
MGLAHIQLTIKFFLENIVSLLYIKLFNPSLILLGGGLIKGLLF